MIKGVTVTVVRPTYKQDPDRFGNPIEDTPVEETVDDVLVAPGSTGDIEAARPQGVTVAYTLHFPKGYDASLEGCSVELPAPWTGTYRVIGDPRPYIDANTPTAWHLPVEVEAAHG